MSLTMRRLALLCLFVFHVASALSAQESAALSKAVQPFVDRQELAGAVMLVADRDKVRAVETVGCADITAKRAMTADAIFWIASQSKPITAAAVMTLVDEGRLSLDDTVERYLPEFRNPMVIAEKDNDHVLLRKPQRPITVRMLLAHTSGLPFKSPIEEPTLDRLPLADRVRSYAMLPLEFEPESKYLYSNAGINTAARILEVIIGQPFEQILDERLFQPLEMRDTSFWPNDEQIARLAHAYKPGANNQGLEETRISQLFYPLTNHTERTPMPGGGLFSTAHDISRFYRMLLNGGQLDGRRVLQEASVRELTKRQTPADLKESYGLGFSVSPTTFGHGGAYSTNTTADSERGLVTVWLVQHAGFPGDGAKSHDAFRKAALEHFAPTKK